jgi:hypothetical protein
MKPWLPTPTLTPRRPGLNRSEMVELALRNEHLRRALRAEVNTSL